MGDEQRARTTHRVRASATHTLSVSEYGNPRGTPAVFLHGGPGSGCRAASVCRLFDLRKFRVVAPDQRGAGKSEPKGCLEDNTTQHLIADLEVIRERLDIPEWLVVGGSWGALLAIAYAQSHPRSVSGIVIRSFFFGDGRAMQRAFIDVPRLFYPELYERFIAFLDPAERANPLTAYYRRLLDPDPTRHVPAIHMWHDYERVLSVLSPKDLILPTASYAPDDKRPLPNTPRVEAHYFSRDSFLKPNELIDNAARLRGIKGVIVQGRYDMLCPPCAAHELLRHWPDGEMVIVDAAGHSQSEANTEQEIAHAIERVAN